MRETPELWDAFADVIEAGQLPPNDDSGRPILDQRDSRGQVWPRYYRGKTEKNAAGETPPPGYFLLGMEAEAEDAFYNGESGQDGLYRIHCWATRPDDARKLYRWLKGLLHRVALTVPGYDPVSGILSKAGPFPDADGASYQIQATYQAEATEAVP